MTIFSLYLITAGASLHLTSSMLFPKLIAFDLDGTVWSPDMYELWGGGAPFQPVSGKTGVSTLIDRSGTKVRLLGDIANILHELRCDHPDVITTWVSCTDEPRWAQECLDKFTTAHGDSIGSCINGKPQIFKANKQVVLFPFDFGFECLTRYRSTSVA